MKISAVLIALLIIANTAAAQAQSVPAEGEMNMKVYYIILFVLFILLLNVIFIPLFREQKSESETADSKAAMKKSVLGILFGKLSGLKPAEAEQSLIIDEDYDGIKELDNNVPPWFNLLFYGTIVIAVIYLINYHVLKIGKLPLQEYADEVRAAEIQREDLIRTGAFINETTVELLSDAESLNSGKQIYSTNCVPCHGDNGGGTVGPNLTDEFWIHGGGIKNVFKTIKYGVPAKGMISWMNQFNPKMIQQVSSYVLSLQGTKPLNGKPPEGDRYIENQDTTKSKSDTIKSTKDTAATNKSVKDSLNGNTSKKNQ